MKNLDHLPHRTSWSNFFFKPCKPVVIKTKQDISRISMVSVKSGNKILLSAIFGGCRIPVISMHLCKQWKTVWILAAQLACFYLHCFSKQDISWSSLVRVTAATTFENFVVIFDK